MLNSKKDLTEFFFLLICADILFMLLHLLHTYTSYFHDTNYSIQTDRGFAEVFQYLKGYWIVLMFFWLSLAKSYSYLAWLCLFAYLVVDDSFELHERLGLVVANYFDYQPMLMLRVWDFGELTASAIMGTVFLTMVGVVYYWGSDDFRRTCKRLVILLLLLVFFGVLVDMIHIMISTSSIFHELAGLLEDGGELLVMSVICWYVLKLLRQARGLVSVEAG
ncbi:MAG: hypothetical protein L6R45_13875 [Anaerolineae bacterium]|nr:hypothetical protein [Anaerolineae bacterium]